MLLNCQSSLLHSTGGTLRAVQGSFATHRAQSSLAPNSHRGDERTPIMQDNAKMPV
jgi:hypothetical protein